MAIQNQTNIGQDARAIYDRIKESLEATHANQFVAIEPISGQYFLGATLSEAIGASRGEYPDRLAHAFRLGHKAAIH
jgi:hypothetical protein